MAMMMTMVMKEIKKWGCNSPKEKEKTDAENSNA